MWRCFPCPHADCMLSQTWYQDLKSHYRVAHGQVLCDNEAKSEQKRRREEAMLQKVFLLSSKIVSCLLIGGPELDPSSIHIQMPLMPYNHWDNFKIFICLLIIYSDILN